MNAGQSCDSCRHFIDYRADDDIPGEANGYCGELVNRLGLEKAIEANPYGGHWTRDDLWCDKWEPLQATSGEQPGTVVPSKP